MTDSRQKETAKSRYVVLFTQTLKLWEVNEVIRRGLPEDKGIVFYPCVELWMASLGRNVIEPLFPGYLFIRSDLSRRELHDFIRTRRNEVLAFIREMRISQERLAGEDGFDDDIADLTDEEAELLDFMLGFRYEAEETDIIETDAEKTKSGKRIYRRKLPNLGVLAMSRGYKDADGSYVVMEGPLKGQGDRITDVNPKDRRAYLNLTVGGRKARVGLELKSKRHWYPNDKTAPIVLSDGYMIDTDEMAAEIMRPKAKTSNERRNKKAR